MDGGCALRGEPPRRLRAAPLPRGEWVWTGVLGLDCFARLAMTVRRDEGRRTGAGQRPARHCEAAVALAIRTIDMRRSNPGLTYNPAIRTVCCPPGTGLLRTCNIVRISGVAVLRKDGARRRDGGGRV
ncbi:MAG: hypothetical protein LBM98_01600 [Oscillospiraceae bacterium]|nr:hypothetical protein [Oscillospiraceae bacterium]